MHQLKVFKTAGTYLTILMAGIAVFLFLGSLLTADTDLEWLLYIWLFLLAAGSGYMGGRCWYRKPFSAGTITGIAGAVLLAVVFCCLFPPLRQAVVLTIFCGGFTLICLLFAFFGSISYRAGQLAKAEKVEEK